MSAFRGFGTQDAADGSRQPAPLAGFANELFAARAGEGIEARLAIVRGDAPFGGDPALRLQALQGGVQRAVIDEENILGLFLNGARDSLAVLGAEDQHAENEHIERTLQERNAILFLFGSHWTRVWGGSG